MPCVAGEGGSSRSSKVVQEKNGGAGGRGGLHIKVENSEMGEVGDRNPRIQENPGNGIWETLGVRKP